jgi:hypothetical protein
MDLEAKQKRKDDGDSLDGDSIDENSMMEGPQQPYIPSSVLAKPADEKRGRKKQQNVNKLTAGPIMVSN